MMKKFVMKYIVRWITDNLDEELLGEWAEKAHDLFIEWTDEGLALLAVEAQKSDTKIDDVLVGKLRLFRDQLIPKKDIVL